MSAWDLVRLSLVRFGASLMVVLTTGVVNRVFIGELGYSQAGFTFLLCLQQFVTPLTLFTSHWSDTRALWGRRRVPHIILWSLASAAALALLMLTLRWGEQQTSHRWTLFLVAAFSTALFGLGVKASNLVITALLVDRLPSRARTSALTFIWFMAILGLLAGGVLYGQLFAGASVVELGYLNRVAFWTAIAVVALTLLGTIGIEPKSSALTPARRAPLALSVALRIVGENPHARWFFGFMALAEFSFFCQDLILEVFGGAVFQLSIGATAAYNSYIGLGTLMGMALGFSLQQALWVRNRVWQLPAACGLGAVAFALLTGSALGAFPALAIAALLLLGVAKGAYNAALAGALMDLMDRRLVGVLLGAWGTMSGIAIGAGMFTGGVVQEMTQRALVSIDVSQTWAARVSYATVFSLEFAGLVVAGLMLWRFKPMAYRERLEQELQRVEQPLPAAS